MRPALPPSRKAALLLLSALALFCSDATHAQSTATANASGNWSSTAIWTSTPAGFAPINGQNGQNWNAIINNSFRTVTVDAATTLEGLTFSAGNIQGANTLTLNAASTWTGGFFSTSGGITNFGNGLAITANGQTLTSRTVNMAGTSSIGNGTIIISASGSLVNNGTFDINNATALNFDGSFGAGFLVNNGTLNKAGAGTAAMITGASYYNNGLMNVDEGIFATGNGGSASGTFDIDSGAQFRVSGGAFAMSSTAKVNGLGLFNATGGTTTFNGVNSGNTGNLGIAGGTLAFASGAAFTTDGGFTGVSGTLNGLGTVTFKGASTWTGGTFNTSGGVTNFDGGLAITANGQTLTSRTVNLSGTSSIGSGTIIINVSGNLVNNGTLNMSNATTLNFDGSFSPGTLTNNGTINKTGAGTVATITGDTFSNPGTLNVAGGTFSPTGMPQHSGTSLTGGTWNVSNGANLNFVGGSNITTIGSNANVTLDGAGSTFAKINTLTTNQGSFTLKNDRDFTTSGALANSGTVSVQNTGTVLTIGAGGANAYTQTGPSSVTILAGGAMIDTSAFNLNGGSLQGTGVIDGPLTANTGNATTIAPGASPGTITINGNTILGGSNVLAMELGGWVAGTDYDVLDVNGVLTLGGLLNLSFINLFEDTIGANSLFNIVTTDSAVLGSFSNVANGGTIYDVGTNHLFSVHYGAGSLYNPNNVVLFAITPEPSRALLLLMGLGGLALRRKRKL